AVETTVARREAECRPALEDGGIRCSLEAADVVAPESETAERERQPTAQGLCHRLVARGGVSAPVHGQAMATRGRRAGEEHRVPRAALLLEHVEDHAVVEL